MSNTTTTASAPALSPRAKILSSNPLFAALDRPDLETLAAFASERPMRKDETLFRRGDRCTGVLGVNRPRHVMQARMKMAESLDWSPVAALFG